MTPTLESQAAEIRTKHYTDIIKHLDQLNLEHSPEEISSIYMVLSPGYTVLDVVVAYARTVRINNLIR